MASPQSQSTSMQRLHYVDKRIVRVLEPKGGVMDEFANPTGPRGDALARNCCEFMQSIKSINYIEVFLHFTQTE